MSTPLPIASARSSARHLWIRIGAHRARFAAAIVSALLAAGCGLVPPFVVGAAVNTIRRGDGTSTDMLRYAIIVASAAVAGALLTYLARAVFASVAETTVGALREELLDHALHLDGEVIEKAGGDLVSRVADDSRVVATSVAEILPMLLIAAASVVATIPGLFGVDWRLGLVGLVAIPMYWLSLRWYLPRSGPLYARERATLGRRTGHLLDGIQGSATVRAFGRWNAVRGQVDLASAQSSDAGTTVFRMLTRFFALNNRAEFVVTALILVAGFVLVDHDQVSVGAVATAALLYHRLFNPIGAVVVTFDEVQSAAAALTRMIGVIEYERPTRAAVAPNHIRRLVADAVEHSYVSDRVVLAPTSIEIAVGERVALVGASGAGKTTLAAILGGVLAPRIGAATLDGVTLRDIDESELRQRVSYVAQETHVFAGTIRHNLLLGMAGAGSPPGSEKSLATVSDDDHPRDNDPGANQSAANQSGADDAIWSALDAVGARDWVAALPKQLDEPVGRGQYELDPVAAQQLALARVLLIDPDFVILDEATAEEGSSGSANLEAAADAVTAGRGALVVAHRLAQARRADRIIVMDRGRITASGTHDELVAAGGHYAKLWEAWSETGTAANR